MGRKAKSLRNGITRTLARPGDPLITRDGRTINPIKKHKDVKIGRPTVTPQNFHSTKRRSMKELAADHDVMKPVAVVLIYSLLGLSDLDISDALGVDEERIQIIREHPAYGDSFDAICGEFINSNSDLLMSRVAGYAHEALDSLADIAINGKHESVRSKSAIDLLDRGGVGVSAGKFGSKASGVSNEMRIVISDGDTTTEIEINGQQFGG